MKKKLNPSEMRSALRKEVYKYLTTRKPYTVCTVNSLVNKIKHTHKSIKSAIEYNVVYKDLLNFIHIQNVDRYIYYVKKAECDIK